MKVQHGLERTQEEKNLLQCLEEDLWREETRFDRAYMETLFAADFWEMGRCMSEGRITAVTSLTINNWTLAFFRFPSVERFAK